jgi:Putative polyhydroxyalkanoic acid system protein (PHA_gran_rgn)
LRITVSHNRSPEEIKQAIDRSFDDVFKSVAAPVQLVVEQRAWEGNKLNFSLVAKMGFMNTPINGTVEVTDRDLTIDVNLGMLEKLIPVDKVRDVLTNKVKGFLK